MRPLKHVETWGNGGIVMEPIHKDGPVLLNPGDELTWKHHNFHLSTPAAYDAEYGNFHKPRVIKPEWPAYRAKEIEKENANTPYIFGLASVICAGEHPDKGKVFIKVEPGMKVLVDGKYYTLVRRMNDNLGLVPLEPEKEGV